TETLDPVGDKHSSPITHKKKLKISHIGFINSVCCIDIAIIIAMNDTPAKVRPITNLRGVEGLYLPNFCHSIEIIGANITMKNGLIDWNQPAGISKLISYTDKSNCVFSCSNISIMFDLCNLFLLYSTYS